MSELANFKIDYVAEEWPSADNVTYFPGYTPEEKSNNAKRGAGAQTVQPIQRYEDILAMARWLHKNKEPKYLLAFTLGINIGLRANELLGICWEDVLNADGSIKHNDDYYYTQGDVIYLYQSKTDKRRPIFLNQACVDALSWYTKDILQIDPSEPWRPTGHIFTSREGGGDKPITVDMFRKVLKEAADACGIHVNIGTHTLRKTWGYWCRTKACVHDETSLTLIQAAFGHSSPEITMRYIGANEAEFKKLYHQLGGYLNVVRGLGLYGEDPVNADCTAQVDEKDTVTAMLLEEIKRLSAKVEALSGGGGALVTPLV